MDIKKYLQAVLHSWAANS